MSISTTKKFIVKGKSVDFINREGSSLSIPKKGPARLPNCLSYSLFLLTEDGASEMVGIAQQVEQRTENPRFTNSNLVPDT
ncbi:hypothetical protein NC653_041379 [Populus alba x Populus x berolinensis]|uniref:Uncharacterized protein n=1 Tax=Populus alba x Populus x berolinensis TaxID=444605 RepID=A0AAD6PNX6_9ROSI|nr:hypothetical protein NC653_041379 [Populus alba x Populus x berolinensis]